MALKTVLTAMPTFFMKMPTNCAGVTGNRNLLTTRWGLNLEYKNAQLHSPTVVAGDEYTFNTPSFSPDTTFKLYRFFKIVFVIIINVLT